MFRRSSKHTPVAGGAHAGETRRQGRGRMRRLLPAAVAVAVLAILSRPGRRAARSFAKSVDARVEHFSDPESRMYARFVAPLLGRLYRGVANDVVAELAARGRSRRAAILDLGCGPGDLALELAHRLRDARIVGLDLSPSMMQIAARHATTDGRLRFVVGDATALPFSTGTVDVVVSTLSLHHWADPAAVFYEIARVLRPGGVALIYDIGLLSATDAELATFAADAGLDQDELVREPVRGAIGTRLFVRFRLEGPQLED
jgi:ubiquinone/menaquinone biosynthesis C-methylase UbiE